jgi:hypothetical protein
MKKSAGWIIAGVSIPLIAAGLYFYLKTQTKEAYANTIKKYGKSMGEISQLLTFDKPYLKAWAKAARKGQETFEYQGKTYNTQGGSAKK